MSDANRDAGINSVMRGSFGNAATLSAVDRVWDDRQRAAMRLVRLMSRARTIDEISQIADALGHVEVMFQSHADALANDAIRQYPALSRSEKAPGGDDSES